MPHDHRERLRNIRQFHQLVEYLSHDLQWPIETNDFEDLTFDYDAEDLGLDFKTAAKIQSIKQLRPLVTNQPWGIFFVEFEPKSLPVVALRRILGRLVIKKRASANKSEMASWQLNDLLFISSYGEGDNRQISLAHFSENEQLGDLPTLRVLGWDGNDRGLKLDHVHNELQTKLRWPEDDTDLNAWCEQWSSVFTLRHREVITTSQQLAVRLADLASSIRRRVNAALAVETENGPMRKLMKAFQEALIHDLKADDFADMYAQTIAYGLLSARVSRQSGALVADDMALMVPVTSPFLRELMETFLHLGGRKQKGSVSAALDFDELGINDVVDLLRQANMEAVLRDFDNRNPQEDPVLHFYELFLKEYDAKKRMQRGVFYTPKPVVSYIVRSVHELLQHEFGLEDGLADTATWQQICERHPDISMPQGVSPDQPFVQILDPATGTATFLVEVIDVIHRTLTTKWKQQHLTDEQQRAAWNDYVPKHLLPRLHGYELMMAPYAIAHMKIGLKLYETGYRFGSDERAHIYLTNALEPPQDFSDRLAFDAPALAHEAQAVNAVKRHERFTVVIGNPPYAQYSMNLNDAARAHIERFRYANGQKIRVRNPLQLERNLNDDYVKFLGFSSALLPPGAGVLGMITNRMFLDSAYLVGLREWFVTNFDQIYIVDLWGSSEESRRVARLAEDENVFDILQGVAMSLFVRCQSHKAVARLVHAREVIGKREAKYRLLIDDLAVSGPGWDKTMPTPEMWRLHRRDDGGENVEREFTLAEIFPQFSTLVASNRDHLVVDFDREPILRNVREVQSFTGSNEELSQRFDITLKSGWNITAAREKLRSIGDLSAHMQVIEYRPFDRRWIFFHPTLVWQTAPVSSNNILGHPSNRIMISLGKNRAETINGHWVARTLADKSAVSTRDNASGFPLYLYDAAGDLNFAAGAGRPNLSPDFLRYLADRRGVSQTEPHGLPQGLTSEDIFHYAYAVLHSPGYRSRYAELLKIDFPRLPLTGNVELFRALARLGSELVSLHLMESPRLNHHLTTYVGPANPEVEKVSYSNDTVWLDKAQTRGFRGVPEAVWNFHIGGYQVCEKWLKDRQANGGKNPRPGRRLNEDDMNHYQRIVVALQETTRLMGAIDEVINQHGGWPDAFMAESVHREETDATEPSA